MTLTKKQRANLKRIAGEKHTITASLVSAPSRRDKGAEYTLRYRDDGEHGGYHENHIRVVVHPDGSLHFCGDPESEQVYLYPEQVKYLKQILRGMTTQTSRTPMKGKTK